MGVILEIVNIISENLSTVTIIVLLTLSFSVHYFLLYPIFFHPLSKIPGPKIACLSKYWILYKTWAEQRNCLVHDLHLKYGPIIRIGPNEIDISDADYIKDIYMKNFDKSSFYSQFGWYGELNTFSKITKDEHKESRKISNKFYSKSSVTSPDIENLVQETVSKVIKQIDENKQKPFEVYNLFQAMAMDIVSSFSFGEGTAKLILDDLKERELVLNSFRLQSSMMFWTTLLPNWKKHATSPEIDKASDIARDWISSSFESSLIDKDTIDKKSLAGVLKSGGKTNNQAASEIGDHVAAGHQTTGVALSYILFELSKPENLKYQAKLKQEFMDHFDILSPLGNFKLPEYKQVDGLPYLNAIISEGLRLHAPIPGQEPRIVPPQGFTWRGTNSLKQDIFIPGKTLVSMQPYSLHRNESVFPDPETFNPERWLTKNLDKLRDINKHFMAFGAGIRMCIGMNLALEEMKLCLAGIYMRFNTSLDPIFDYDDKMFMVDKYTIHPKGHECNIIFKGD